MNTTEIIFSLNPLKRVKFISIQSSFKVPSDMANLSLNPLKRVKFISIIVSFGIIMKMPGTVSIPSNGSSLFQSLA